MCDSTKPFKGFPICSFYGTKKLNNLHILKTRRKLKLDKLEKYVTSKRSADAVALNIYHYNKYPDENVRNIVTSHSKTHVVFSKQNDAIWFSQNKHNGELSVFAFEINSTGGRNFLSSHPETVWSFYKDLEPSSRHYYEVITENQPCKLYFDIEYKKELNKSVNGDNLLQKFIEILINDLQETFNLKDISKQENIIDLTSSTDSKFSHHLIINHPQLVFASNYHAGKYVKYLCYKLKSIPEMKITTGKNLDTRECSNTTTFGIFVDEGVYTKNRNFRLYLSSKFNKNASLTLTNNACNRSDKCIFFNSLVTNICGNYQIIRSSKTKPQIELITFDHDAHQPNVPVIDVKPKTLSMNNPSSCETRNSYENKLSPFPEIDSFIFNMVCHCNGYIRKCAMLENTDLILYEIAGGYKFCENIGRHHKSNNVKILVDLQLGQYYQKCHDSDCEGFASNKYPLPHSAMPWLCFDELTENRQEVCTYKNDPDASLCSKTISSNSTETASTASNVNISDTLCCSKQAAQQHHYFDANDGFDEFISKNLT